MFSAFPEKKVLKTESGWQVSQLRWRATGCESYSLPCLLLPTWGPTFQWGRALQLGVSRGGVPRDFRTGGSSVQTYCHLKQARAVLIHTHSDAGRINQSSLRGSVHGAPLCLLMGTGPDPLSTSVPDCDTCIPRRSRETQKGQAWSSAVFLAGWLGTRILVTTPSPYI